MVRSLHDDYVITTADDLPTPTAGTHELDDAVYQFEHEVVSDTPLELASGSEISVLGGKHREHCWFIYTGGGAAIRGTDASVIIDDLSISAPNGTIFDVDGIADDSEFLIEDCYLADDQERGAINDLGRIGAFRSPKFKNVGLRDFESGLTFDGSVGRVSFNSCTWRDVTASGVTMLEFGAGFDADAVEIVSGYVRKIQSDTEVVRVDPAATVSEVFGYRGTTHDSTVTRSNIFTGAANPQHDPYWVSGSYPLRESGVVGELHLESALTVTIPAQNTWTQVTGGTVTLGNETERTVAGATTGEVEYVGTKDANAHITIPVSFYGANGDIYEFSVAKNGTVEPASVTSIRAGGQNANRVTAPTGIEDLQTNDTVSLVVQNVSNANNVTIENYNISFLGQ